MNTDFIDISYRNSNTIYTINAKYAADSDFEMIWEDSEELKVYLTLNVKHINVKNLATNEVELIKDYDEIKRIVYDIMWRDSYTFEDPVWDCFVEHVKPYKTFLDDQWQFVSLRIMVR